MRSIPNSKKGQQMKQRKSAKEKLKAIKRYMNGEELQEIIQPNSCQVIWVNVSPDDTYSFWDDTEKYTREEFEVIQQQYERTAGHIEWIQGQKVPSLKPPTNVTEALKLKDDDTDNDKVALMEKEEQQADNTTTNSLQGKQYVQERLMEFAEQEKLDLAARDRCIFWNRMQTL